MSQDIYIFEVTEKSFPSAVIENSHKLPVVAGFIGVWSVHCFVVNELFTSLAKEFAGKFVPDLAKEYQRKLSKLVAL